VDEYVVGERVVVHEKYFYPSFQGLHGTVEEVREVRKRKEYLLRLDTKARRHTVPSLWLKREEEHG
jgi:hypothetical protein